MLRTRTSRRLARTCAVAALSAAAAGAAGTAGTASAAPALTATAATSARVDFVAVTGTDGAVYVRATDQSTFQNVGGHVASEPVIATSADDAYLVVVGTDHQLYARTSDVGWHLLSPAGTYCKQAGATTNVHTDRSSTLAVACLGRDDSLSVGKVRIPAGAATATHFPRLTSMTNKGGRVRWGTNVGVRDMSADTFYYMVVGFNNVVYQIADDAGYSVVDDSVRCYGPLSRDAITDDGAACRAADGSLNVLRPDLTFGVIKGLMVGRAGVAVDDDGTSRYYVLGTDDKVYVATQSPSGALSGWHRSVGIGRYGVSAASLDGAVAAARRSGTTATPSSPSARRSTLLGALR